MQEYSQARLIWSLVLSGQLSTAQVCIVYIKYSGTLLDICCQPSWLYWMQRELSVSKRQSGTRLGRAELPKQALRGSCFHINMGKMSRKHYRQRQGKDSCYMHNWKQRCSRGHYIPYLFNSLTSFLIVGFDRVKDNTMEVLLLFINASSRLQEHLH